MSSQRFPIRIGARSALLLRLAFGVRRDNAWVDVGEGSEGRLVVSFGRFHFETSLANCASWRIEGPFLWITAIGVRMSLRHRDVSFDGSPHGGVRIDFHDRVPWGAFHIPAIYVAADDLAAFAAALAARGITGSDARKRIVP
jgi:hypothetical protein